MLNKCQLLFDGTKHKAIKIQAIYELRDNVRIKSKNCVGDTVRVRGRVRNVDISSIFDFSKLFFKNKKML